MNLSKQKILLGVTGGIAAYKSADLVRRLQDAGADVQVVMTDGACEFITPLTMQAVSGKPVRRDLFDLDAEAAMGHIELARWADKILIAPASADFIARLVVGMTNDLLSTVCLATDKPIHLAPAMNKQMWANSATQANIKTLTGRGIHIIEPASGEQACGEVGAGRMPEPLELVDYLNYCDLPALFTGKHIVITAGPTQEALDPVRYISNHSSGKMGYAVARAAAAMGAQVTLITGPTQLEIPAGVTGIQVLSAADMFETAQSATVNADIFIATAAVADYRAANLAEHKIKKQDNTLSLELTKNTDILAEISRTNTNLYTVGFAAETQNLVEHAREKLQRKKLNMVAANLVGNGLAFGCDDNSLTVVTEKNETELSAAPKTELAISLLKLIQQEQQTSTTKNA